MEHVVWSATVLLITLSVAVNGDPYMCASLFTNYDLSGDEQVICKDDYTYVGDGYNDDIHSFELDCDQPCYATFWGGNVGDYSWGPSPLTFESITERTGSFSNDEIGGYGLSHVEVREQDRCVELFEDYDLGGRSAVVCKSSYSLPWIVNGNVRSFRFLCGDDECVATMWEGGYSRDYDTLDYGGSSRWDNVYDLSVDGITIDYSYARKFLSGAAKTAGKAGDKKAKAPAKAPAFFAGNSKDKKKKGKHDQFLLAKAKDGKKAPKPKSSYLAAAAKSKPKKKGSYYKRAKPRKEHVNTMSKRVVPRVV